MCPFLLINTEGNKMKSKFSIEDIEGVKEKYLLRKDLKKSIQTRLSSMDVILFPFIDFRKDVSVCFPERTGEIYKYLQAELLKHETSIDMAVNDEEYEEIELHDAVITLPILFVAKQILLPLVISLLANWIYGRYKQTIPSEKEPTIKFTAIVPTSKGNKEIKFEGDAKSFAKLGDKIKL
jgi:hypothetical protein